MHTSKSYKIALTTGEPSGIGPDIVLQVAQYEWPVTLIAIGDPVLLAERAKQLRLCIDITEITETKQLQAHQPGHLYVIPVKTSQSTECGKLDVNNAAYVLACLDRAIAGCLSQQFDAMVTAPVHKGIINQAGFDFSGHTEYLAKATHADQVVMLFESEKMRVALASTHIPLAKVASFITPARLTATIHVLHKTLQHYFGCTHPSIALCGLNPHAGENGYIGHEEQEIIIPVIKQLQAEGLNVHGPYSADTAFFGHHIENVDAFLAMYHDQALPVVKYASFGTAINITCGLPFIRTSVDHGTALELAGTGQAKADSLRYAIMTTIKLIRECRERN